MFELIQEWRKTRFGRGMMWLLMNECWRTPLRSRGISTSRIPMHPNYLKRPLCKLCPVSCLSSQCRLFQGCFIHTVCTFIKSVVKIVKKCFWHFQMFCKQFFFLFNKFPAQNLVLQVLFLFYYTVIFCTKQSFSITSISLPLFSTQRVNGH